MGLGLMGLGLMGLGFMGIGLMGLWTNVPWTNVPWTNELVQICLRIMGTQIMNPEIKSPGQMASE